MICVFALTGRSGSTSLSEAIHKNMKNAGEWLAEPLSDGYENWGVRHLEKLPKITLSNLQDVAKQYNVTLVKTLEFYLNVGENIKLLNMFSDNVLLYRKYFVDHYVSKWMSCDFKNQTNTSAFYRDEIRNTKDFFKLVRNPVDIEQMISNYNLFSKKIKTYIDKVNFDSIITYESFYCGSEQDRKTRLLELFDKLKIEPKDKLDLSPLSIDGKHNSYDNYERLIPNWKEVLSLKEELILQE